MRVTANLVHALSPTIELGAHWPPLGIEGAPNEDISDKICSSISHLYLVLTDKCYEHPRGILLIIVYWWIAECECVVWSGLPLKDNNISRNWHAEDNKSDTHYHFQPTGNILSRIHRCFSRNANRSASNSKCYQKSGWSFNRESQNWNVQTAKSIWTLNGTNSQLRDRTASINMRRRSLHSKRELKGDSWNSLEPNVLDGSLQKKPGKSDKPEWVSGRLGATTVVQRVLEQRELKTQKHYKLLDILSNPHFLEKCYAEIKSKPGNMTKGTYNESLDRINWIWFEKVAAEIKSGKFDFRAKEIPKNNGKKRPLGISSPRDKIVQKGLHAVLEAIFEPIFIESSHGFRSGRSVHTALLELYLKGNKYNWVIQGDISKCFDNIPHQIIMKYLSEKIGDPRILELLKKFISAGYVDEKGIKHNPNLGTPQGGILSPLLANIVLHKMDVFMMEEKKRYDKGDKRRKNPTYATLQAKKAKTINPVRRKEILDKMRNIKRSDSFDPNYRRLMYIRYADDFVVTIAGPIRDAEYIRNRIKDMLSGKCGLELNQEKTIISSMTGKWNFLGAEIRKLRTNRTWLVNHSSGGRSVGIPRILVNAPINRILTKLKDAKLIKQNKLGKIFPIGYTPVINLSHQEILSFFNAKARGIVNFYSFATNKSSLYGILWFLKASCALTLARKYKLGTLSKVFQKFGYELKCEETGMTFFKPDNLKSVHDFRKRITTDLDKLVAQTWAGKNTQSIFSESCTICGSKSFVEMHHIRSVKNIRAKFRKGENITMAEFKGAILRKQVPLCSYHHSLLHKGQLNWSDLKKVHKYNKRISEEK